MPPEYFIFTTTNQAKTSENQIEKKNKTHQEMTMYTGLLRYKTWGVGGDETVGAGHAAKDRIPHVANEQ